jgi:magnesium chelatase family protein
VLPVALSCRRGGFTPLVVPADNAAEAAVVGGLRVMPVATLQDTVDFLNGEREPPSPPANVGRWMTAPSADAVDFADVRGHAHAKRALEIAAAGAHNVMRLGPIPSRPDSASCWSPGADVHRWFARRRAVVPRAARSVSPDVGQA